MTMPALKNPAPPRRANGFSGESPRDSSAATAAELVD
jgi:hypothetical protein